VGYVALILQKFKIDPKILLTAKQMYSIINLQFGVMSSEFGVKIENKKRLMSGEEFDSKA